MRKPLALMCFLVSAYSMQAQDASTTSIPFGYTKVFGSHIGGDRSPMTKATIEFTPVAADGTPISFRAGGARGAVMSRAATAQVVHGAFTITLPDLCLSSPVNVRYRVDIIDNRTKDYVRDQGYSSVQPCGSFWSLDSSKRNFPALLMEADGTAQVPGAQGIKANQNDSGAARTITAQDTNDPSAVTGLLRSHCATGAFTGYTESYCNPLTVNQFEPGWNYGGTDGQGWRVTHARGNNFNSHTSGINEGFTQNMNTFGDGDAVGIKQFFRHLGGDPDASGEGKIQAAFQGGESGRVLTAILKSAALDGSSIQLAKTSNVDIASDAHFIIDTAGGGLSLHVLGDNGNNVLTVDGGASASTLCTLSSDAHPAKPLPDQNGSPVTLAASCTQGALVAGKSIAMACTSAGDNEEYVSALSVSSQGSGHYSVSTKMRIPHHAGCSLYQGGTRGTLDFLADRVLGHELNGGGGLIRTAYEIVGALDATHLVYRLPFLGSGKSIPEGQHNYGSTTQYKSATRANNVVTACEVASGSPVSLLQVTVRASSPNAALNGRVTPTTFLQEGSCLQWAQNGPDLPTPAAVTLSIGGMDAYGAAIVWPAARARSVVADANQYPSGKFGLAPNDVAWAVGDPVEQEHGEGNLSLAMDIQQIDNRIPMPNAPSATLQVRSAGPGMVNGKTQFSNTSVLFDNRDVPASVQVGSGGQMNPIDQFTVLGRTHYGLHFDVAPDAAMLEVGSVGPLATAGVTSNIIHYRMLGGQWFETINQQSNTVCFLNTAGSYRQLCFGPGGATFNNMPIDFGGQTLSNVGSLAALTAVNAPEFRATDHLIVPGGDSRSGPGLTFSGASTVTDFGSALGFGVDKNYVPTVAGSTVGFKVSNKGGTAWQTTSQGETTQNGNAHLNAVITAPNTPKSGLNSCTPNAMWHDDNYLYFCNAAGSGSKRVAGSAF